MPSDPLGAILERFGPARVASAIRENLADELESYEPALIRRHFDADRFRDDLLPEFERVAKGEGHEYPRHVAGARIDALLRDWDQLQAVLEDRLGTYVDLDAAARELEASGAWVTPGVLTRLDAAIELLDEDPADFPVFMACESCGAPPRTGHSLCGTCIARFDLD